MCNGTERLFREIACSVMCNPSYRSERDFGFAPGADSLDDDIGHRAIRSHANAETRQC
jgi:hypothetical protein